MFNIAFFKPLHMRAKASVLSGILILLFCNGCSDLTSEDERKYSTAYSKEIIAKTFLAQRAEYKLSTIQSQEGFYSMSSGLDAFASRLILIKSAEISIDIQTYVFNTDTVGYLLAYYLLQAADRGVRVRLLLDDFGSKWPDKHIRSLSTHPNVDVRLFNPVADRGLLKPFSYMINAGRLLRRMHNKAMIVDGSMAIVGGRNLGDEYFGQGEIYFSDLDTLLIGSVVIDTSTMFDQFWNYRLSYPVESLYKHKPPSNTHVEDFNTTLIQKIESIRAGIFLDRVRNSSFYRLLENNELHFFTGSSRLIFDKPEKIEKLDSDTSVKSIMMSLFENFDSDLFIISPYFIPTKNGVSLLDDMLSQGKKVTVLTNSLASTNQVIVHSAYRKYREQILASGVVLYESKPFLPEGDISLGTADNALDIHQATLHAKMLVFDNTKVFVGSLNLDPRSWNINTEMGVLINSPSYAEKLIQQAVDKRDRTYQLFLDDYEHLRWRDYANQDVIYSHDPETSWWQRFKVILAGFLPIESQL